MSDFKSTANQANNLLGSLQASADNLKEMVRYEVARAGSTDKKEVEELREKVKGLEQKLRELDRRDGSEKVNGSIETAKPAATNASKEKSREKESAQTKET